MGQRAIFPHAADSSAAADVFDKFDETGSGRVATTQLEAMLEAIGRNPGEGMGVQSIPRHSPKATPLPLCSRHLAEGL